MTGAKKKARIAALWGSVQQLYNAIQPGSRFRVQHKLLHAKTIIDELRDELALELAEAQELPEAVGASTKESDNGPKTHKKK